MAVHKDGYCVFIYLYIIYRKLTSKNTVYNYY